MTKMVQVTESNTSNDNHRWWVLGLLTIAEMLGMSLWMTASAVTPKLAELWQLEAAQGSMLTTMVQIGFVAGTAIAALMNLADILANRTYFVGCAVAAALANLFLLWAPGYELALLFRFFTGFFLAGVYPPAMKMAATWFEKRRGLAIGMVVGGVVIGKASPYLIKAFEASDWHVVVILTSIASALGAALVFFGYRDGPYQFERRPFSIALAKDVLSHRPTRLAIFGYLGHMWELYAMWIWFPVFITAAAVASGQTTSEATVWGAAISFVTISAGCAGSIWGGWYADKLGREKLVNLSMAISGCCCVMVGFLYGSSLALIVPFAIIWGFFVVSDSAQFSTMVTEAAPRHSVGTALTLQTSLGFLLTVISIQLLPALEQLLSWRYAFAFLAIGPLFGIISVKSLARLNRQG